MTEKNKANKPENRQDEEQKSQNKVKVEDVGNLKKKVHVTIPESGVKNKHDEMFSELRNSAQIPGFRIGHAPQKLVEKRFGKEISADIRNSLIGDSIGEAIEQAKLKTLGEPEIDLDKIELPDKGDFEFSFDVEVQPEFKLPGLKGIKVTKKVFEPEDSRVNQALENIRANRTSYEKTEKPTREGDSVTASVKITGKNVEHENPRVQVRVAPSVVEGIPLPKLAEKLAGKKAGHSVSIKTTCPDTHPKEDWQSKPVMIDLTVKEVQRKNIPELNDDFAAEFGFDSVAGMKKHIAEDLRSRMDAESRQDMRTQVSRYLINHTDFELPEGFTKRHTAEALNRRQLKLMQYGIPREKIEENLAELQASVDQETVEGLKLSLIVQRIAEDLEIEISPAKINARIAQMAHQYGKRPERFKQDLVNNGMINQVTAAVLEEEVMEKLLGDAKIEEKKPEKKKAPTQKKTVKKTKKKKAVTKAKKKTKKNRKEVRGKIRKQS